MRVKVTMEEWFFPNKWLKIEKIGNIQFDKISRNRLSLICWLEYIFVQTFWKPARLYISKAFKIRILFDPVFSFLGIDPQEIIR